MGKQVKWMPPEEDIIVDQNEQVSTVQKNTWTPPEGDPIVPVKKKDQAEESVSSSDSQDHGEPSGKSTTNTQPQLSEKQKAVFRENVLKTPAQKQAQEAKDKFVDTRLKEAFGIDETPSRSLSDTFVRTIDSGLSDQIPKEYYAQRLRMSKGNFGDLYDRRSDINAFGGPEFSKQLPKGTSLDAFSAWNNKQPFNVKQKSYDERAQLFLTEKLGVKGFEELKSKFAESNLKERIGYEKNIQQQNQEAAIKTAGITQDLKSVKGAGDFMSFAGNMIGQALYRAPLNIGTGPVGSIVSESASVYDRQLDLIAEKNNISREEVIKIGLDKPAEGQALAVLAGTLDSASEFNIIGMFKKAAGKQLTDGLVRQFVKGFVRGAVPEAVTEVAQGELEELAASKGAGTEYHPDAWRMATNAVGATIGGGVLGGGANVRINPALKAMPVQQVVDNASTGLSSGDIKSIENAADIIDAKIQSTDDTQASAPEETTITKKPYDYAVQKRSSDEILQREPEETGSEGSERGGVEPVQQGTSSAEQSVGQEEPNATNEGAQEEAQGQPKNQEQQNITQPNDGNIQQQESTQAGLGGTVQGAEGEAQQGERSGESGGLSRGDRSQEAGQEEISKPSRERQKILLNRAYEGVTDEQIRSSIEKHGLNYEVESHASAEKSAQNFIDEVGVHNAIEAVRNNEVEDGAAAFVWAKAIDEVGRRVAASENKEEIKSLTDEQTKLIDEFDKKARSGGRFISALQDVYKSSDFAYKADYQIKKYKEINNGKIPKEIEEKFKDLEQKLNAANEKIQNLEQSNKKESLSNTVQNIRTDLQAQKERRVKIAKERKQKIDSFFDSLKVKNDPNKLNSITQVIGESVWNGSVEVMRHAVQTGSDIATAVQAGIDYVKEHYRGSDFDEDQYKNTVQPGIEKLVPSEEDIKMPEMRNGKLSIPKALIRQVVESGASTIEDLTSDIHALIKESMPDVSVREVRDAITKYGETRSLSKEELDVKIRELKRVGKLMSSLEDVQNKLRPLRSGLQRDKLTDQERNLQRQIKEGMKDLPVDEITLEQEWKTALDAVKSRLKNQISDLEEQIKTGEKSPKKKGIKYDQEATELKEQRDALKKTIEDIEGKKSISIEEKVRLAIKSVGDSIAEYERRIREKDFESKKSEPAPETPELKAMRQKRDQIKEVYKKMQQDLGIVDKKKLEAYKKNIKKSIGRYQDRIKNNDFITVKKKPIDLDKEATDLRIERDKIKAQFDVEQEKNRRANRSLSEKYWDTFVDVVNLPKSMLASIDMSAPFRQGAVLSISNPKAGAASFAEMFRQAFSQRKSEEWLLKLKDSEVYDLIKKSKLYIAEPTTKLTAKEDQFISNFASKIPLFKYAYKASERAYTGYLNKLRVDVFVNGADRLQESGITYESSPEAYKAWADFVNNATGRGNLGALEEAATVLNGFFFSPRFVASRVNLLNPIKYAKMPPEVRRMAMKNMIAFAGFSALVLTIAAAAGAEVEHDPRSSDFAKMKIGDTRYDIMAGFQQVIRLISQLTTGQRKSTSTGMITDLSGKKFPFENRGDVALRFARSKLAPAAGSAVNLLTGKDIVGNDITIEGELVKNIIPLYIQDIYSLSKSETPTGLLSSIIPAFFGVGVQNYSKKKEKPKQPISPW